MEHEGVIIKAESHILYVEIEQRSACAGCHAKTSCGISDTKKKIVEVNSFPPGLKPGTRVQVVCSTSTGMKAVAYAFVLPLLLVVTTLVLCLSGEVSAPLSAILSLGVVIPYYTVLYFLRDKLKKEFTFTIK